MGFILYVLSCLFFLYLWTFLEKKYLKLFRDEFNKSETSEVFWILAIFSCAFWPIILPIVLGLLPLYYINKKIKY